MSCSIPLTPGLLVWRLLEGGSPKGLPLTARGCPHAAVGGLAASGCRSPTVVQALPLLGEARELPPLKGDPGSSEPGGRAEPSRLAAGGPLKDKRWVVAPGSGVGRRGSPSRASLPTPEGASCTAAGCPELPSARRGWAGPGSGPSPHRLPQTLLPYSRWRPGRRPATGRHQATGHVPIIIDSHSQKALLVIEVFVAGTLCEFVR